MNFRNPMIQRTIGRLGILLLGVFVLAGLAGPEAQAQKLGYVNQEALILNLPDYAQVQQQLQQELQEEQQAFQQEQQEFQEKLEKYQQQQALLSEERRAEREQELMQLQQQLQQSAAERDQTLAQREQELMQPLYEKVQEALETVAQRHNIDAVMRIQALSYVNEDTVMNLTPDVARELGLEVPEDQAPVSAGAGE